MMAPKSNTTMSEANMGEAMTLSERIDALEMRLTYQDDDHRDAEPDDHDAVASRSTG